MNTKDDGNAFEYSRSDDILMAIIVAGMIIGCILSQVFDFLVLPLMASIGRIIGGLIFLLHFVNSPFFFNPCNSY